jgi:hypothetical protein
MLKRQVDINASNNLTAQVFDSCYIVGASAVEALPATAKNPQVYIITGSFFNYNCLAKSQDTIVSGVNNIFPSILTW